MLLVDLATAANYPWPPSILSQAKEVVHLQFCRYIRDGRPPTFNRNPYNGAL